MNILHSVESYAPSICGMQEIVQQISEGLVKRGHKVTVATSRHAKRKKTVINGVHIEQFQISGNKVRGIRGENNELQRYQRLLTSHDFDILTNFAAQQWATDLTLSILPEIQAKKVFVPTGFSGLYYPQYKHYFKQMKHWMRQYDMNVFLSNDYRDVNFARENGVKKRVLIPNGASEEEFLPTQRFDIRHKLGIPPDQFLILLVGAHTGAKGHKEAIEIFRNANIVNAALLIVAPLSWSNCARHCLFARYLFNVSPKRRIDKKQIIVKSLTRQEILDAYKTANLFLFPSNIECSPLVLFEAMASKTPFLVTDVGNSKEIISWSKSGLLLPTTINSQGLSYVRVDQSTKVLESIYNDSQQRIKMASLGYQAWQRRFTWEKITRHYEKLYQSLLH